MLLHKPTEMERFAMGKHGYDAIETLSDPNLKEKVEAWAATKNK